MKIACGLLHQTGQYELRRRSWRVLGLLPRALSVVEMRVDGTGTADIVAGNPDIGKMLIVRLINTNQSSPAGPYVTFDNVRLTAAALIPLPAPGLMLLSGLGGLALLSRTRSRGA